MAFAKYSVLLPYLKGFGVKSVLVFLVLFFFEKLGVKREASACAAVLAFLV